MKNPFSQKTPDQALSDEGEPFHEATLIKNERERLTRYQKEFPFKRLVMTFLLGTGIAGCSQDYSRGTVEEAADQAGADLKTPDKIPEGDQQAMSHYLEMAKKDIGQFFIEFEHIKNKPFAAEGLVAAAHTDPEFFMDKISDLQGIANADDLQTAIEQAMLLDPRYLVDAGAYPGLKDAFEKSQNTDIHLMDALNTLPISHAKKKRAATLLQNISDGTLTAEQAVILTEDQKAWTKRLIQIKAQKDHLACHAIDIVLEGLSKSTVVEMNDLHEQTDHVRFAALNNLPPSELYTYIVYAGEDAYPSTFNGTFNHLLSEMKERHMTGDQLMKEIGNNGMRNFFQKASEYKRLSEFLSTMSASEQERFVLEFVEGLEQSEDLSTEGAVIADVVRTIQDSHLRSILASGIEHGYRQTANHHNPEALAAYGILSLIVDHDAAWIPKKLAPSYEISIEDGLSPEKLLNEKGEIVERYFFYNDEDGQSSFKHFLSRFDGKPGWHIQKIKGGVIVNKTEGDRTIKIYANSPTAEVSTDETVPDLVGEAMVKDGVMPTVIVHRGHVYHNNATIAHIPASAKIVVLGSCGGYLAVESVMQKSNDAHIISTQGTGTKLVNDKLLTTMDTLLLTEDSFTWEGLWNTAGKTLESNADFSKYVRPDENGYAAFMHKFHEATQQI